jgi:hypothetical protein
MTTTPTETTDPIAEVCEANARYVDDTYAAGHGDVLMFLRYRPERELVDTLDAARRLGLSTAQGIIHDALRLARGHTGGLSNPPRGWTGVDYPVTQDDTDKLLAEAADAARRIRLPGGGFGWAWKQEVTVDPDARTVTVTMTARHATD